MKNSRYKILSTKIIRLGVAIILFSCNKEQVSISPDEVISLAAKYNFTVVNKPGYTQNQYANLSLLEKSMSSISQQKNYLKIIRTDSTISSDSSIVNRNIQKLKSRIFVTEAQIKKMDFDNSDVLPVFDNPSSSPGDPTYKYSQTLYFNNGGFAPNYAVQIQYNAQNGIFTAVNISVNPYGSYYVSGQFAYYNAPQIYYVNGSLAFQIGTSMTYTLNVPGIPFLGFSTTVFNQFNGYLQLNGLNNLVGGAYERTLNGPETNSQ